MSASAANASDAHTEQRDLREWIAQVEQLGELRTVRGASWQADIGAVAEMLDAVEGAPAVLFDEIPGYPAGHRVLVNSNGTTRRQAVTLGLDPDDADHGGMLDFWREALDGLVPIDPTRVEQAPVLETSVSASEVDLASFPAPVWHPGDGGRYLGTACCVAMADPDGGWINYGTYRGQILAADELGLFISAGHHGRTILDRWLERGEPCPVASIAGADPLIFMASCADGFDYGQSELAIAGGLRRSPIAVVPGPVTGLPIPTSAEIVVEGFVHPGQLREEGPYGEWHGYYSDGASMAHFVRVEAIHSRRAPILLGCPQGRPPHEDNRFLAYLKSALAERQLRQAGVPGVTGVWCPPQLGNRLMVIVAVETAYPGHATQTGLVAGQVGATAYGGRFVVVVDDDVDIFDMDQVLWALGTRCDPRSDATLIDRAWSSTLDTAVGPAGHGHSSRMVLDATRPWERRATFPEPVTSAERAREIRAEWGWLLAEPGQDREEQSR